jgi:hypothetical protein
MRTVRPEVEGEGGKERKIKNGGLMLLRCQVALQQGHDATTGGGGQSRERMSE